MQLLALIAGYVVVGIVTALGFLILWRIMDGTIDLSLLVSEKTGQASFSRFQFLIFTFVIAIAVLVLTLEGRVAIIVGIGFAAAAGPVGTGGNAERFPQFPQAGAARAA